MLSLRIGRFVWPGLALVALVAIACGNDSESAPASSSDTPVATPAPTVLSDLDALRFALERKDGGMRSSMVGEPSAVWGAVMTRDEATVLRRGEPISSRTSEYERRNDLVWYFVLEGQIVHTISAGPGPTVEPDISPRFGVVGIAFDAFTGSL